MSWTVGAALESKESPLIGWLCGDRIVTEQKDACWFKTPRDAAVAWYGFVPPQGAVAFVMEREPKVHGDIVIRSTEPPPPTT